MISNFKVGDFVKFVDKPDGEIGYVTLTPDVDYSIGENSVSVVWDPLGQPTLEKADTLEVVECEAVEV